MHRERAWIGFKELSHTTCEADKSTVYGAPAPELMVQSRVWGQNSFWVCGGVRGSSVFSLKPFN